MPYITMVTKRKRNGQPCTKCRDIEARLKREGYFDLVDRVVIADQNDPDSEGRRLAEIYNVWQAPFFLVSNPQGEVTVYTVYYRFVRDVLKPTQESAQNFGESMEPAPLLEPA
ncbi:MAG: hypothetical protein ABW120_03915 [Sedimenticola sp.]